MMGILDIPGISRLQADARYWYPKKLKSRRQVRQWGPIQGWDTTHGAYTWSIMMALPSHATAIRAGFPIVTQGSYTVDGLIVAPTGSIVAGFNTPTGGQSAWLRCPLGGGSLSSGITIPQRVGGADAQAVGATDIQWADWVSLKTVARTDGGTNPLVLLRMYCASANVPTMNAYGSASGHWQDETLSLHMPVLTAFKAGDQTANGQWNQFTSYTTPYATPLMAVEYMSAVTGVTTAEFGDSIMLGYTADPVGSGWGMRSSITLTTNLGFPVSNINGGWQGQRSTVYLQRFINWVSAQRGSMPQICAYAGYSRNDGPTNADDYIGRCHVFIDICQRAGIVPVLVTGIPESATPANNAVMVATNAAIRTLVAATPGCLLYDMEPAITGTGGLPNPALMDADGIHPNNAGNDAMAAVKTAALTTFLAQYS